MSLSTPKKKASPKPKPEKKTSLSDREYVSQPAAEEDIAVLEDGARYLPIDVVERDLDRWEWSTEKFTWLQYKDKFGNICVAASLELVIPWKMEDGTVRERRLSGGCNFVIATYAPNSHFLATAKSECVKNASSDLGKKFGRGLNEGFAQGPAPEIKAVPAGTKMKPNSKILEQYKKALEEGDATVIKVFNDVYEINPQADGN